MFFVTEVMIPHDFTVQFAMTHNRQQREEMRHQLGLDLPLWRRYLYWLGRVVRGELGSSLSGPPVVEVLERMIPFTLIVFFVGTVIAFLLGQWLGKIVAWQRAHFLTSAATLSVITLYTSFPPWLAFLVTYLLTGQMRTYSNIVAEWDSRAWPLSTVMLNMVLAIGAVAIAFVVVRKVLRRIWKRHLPAWLTWLEPPVFVAGVLGGWSVLGFYPQAMSVLRHARLPLLTYVLLSFGETMLIMRTSMTDTLKETYVTTARAKGLPERAIRDRHAARNALLPVLSRLVISIPYLLTGVVIVEQRFNWPGFSGMLFDSFYQQDMPLVLGGLLVVGALSAMARLALDVVYAYLDPRIRYGSPSPQGGWDR
jgi:peptide/nickel transport system permease protein